MKATPASSDARSAKTNQPAPSITYKLSQEVFKNLGWTSLPENAIVFPFVTMKAKFSHDVISPWFAIGKGCVRRYGTGKRLCVSRENGTGRIYYPNGRLAIDVRKTENGTRIVVKTPGGVGRDGVRRRPQLCGLFDSLGNGVVYDCDKRKRIVYNQERGVARLGRDGMQISWKWHELRCRGWKSNEMGKDMSVVEAMRMESQPDTSTDPAPISSMESEEFQKTGIGMYVNTSRIRGSFPMKPIVSQMTPHIALRIFNQADICLTFFADGHQTRLNIGTLYNPCDVLSVDNVYLGGAGTERVWCPFEILPVKTRSMEIIRRLIRNEKSKTCKNLNGQTCTFNANAL